MNMKSDVMGMRAIIRGNVEQRWQVCSAGGPIPALHAHGRHYQSITALFSHSQGLQTSQEKDSWKQEWSAASDVAVSSNRMTSETGWGGSTSGKALIFTYLSHRNYSLLLF